MQVCDAHIMEHSRKPGEIRERIVSLCGDKPRVELFARQEAEGWISLGNEIDGKDIRIAIQELLIETRIKELIAEVTRHCREQGNQIVEEVWECCSGSHVGDVLKQAVGICRNGEADWIAVRYVSDMQKGVYRVGVFFAIMFSLMQWLEMGLWYEKTEETSEF